MVPRVVDAPQLTNSADVGKRVESTRPLPRTKGPSCSATSVQEYTTQGFLERLNTQVNHFGNILFVGSTVNVE